MYNIIIHYRATAVGAVNVYLVNDGRAIVYQSRQNGRADTLSVNDVSFTFNPKSKRDRGFRLLHKPAENRLLGPKNNEVNDKLLNGISKFNLRIFFSKIVLNNKKIRARGIVYSFTCAARALKISEV